jgi:hypothetical protein
VFDIVQLDPAIPVDDTYLTDQLKTKGFTVNRHLKEGLFIYSLKPINDQDLFDTLLMLSEEIISKFSITNG